MREYPAQIEIRPLTGPVEAVVHPPGSKSITNRALIVSALADEGASRLFNALEADDTQAMRECLRALGVLIDDVDDPWLVLGTAGALQAPVATLDARASGTTARFIAALAPLASGRVVIDGTARMRERPIGDLVKALRAVGARIESREGYPPVVIEPGPIHGGTVEIAGNRSSQFVSALLMLGPMLPEPLDVLVRDGLLVSRPYVESTIDVMQAFGAEAWETDAGFHVEPTGYSKAHFHIEADASAAVYPAVAAALCGGIVAIEGIPSGSRQPDLAVLDTLALMGCRVTRGPDRTVVEGSGRALDPVDIDMQRAPDGALGLAVACMFASGPSRLRGLGTLRIKETDRLAALETEINRLGASASIEGDALVVTPGPLRAATVQTYDDHRMAMAFSIAGLRTAGVVIDNPGCVSKTWPGFYDMLASLS